MVNALSIRKWLQQSRSVSNWSGTIGTPLHAVDGSGLPVRRVVVKANGASRGPKTREDYCPVCGLTSGRHSPYCKRRRP